MDLKSIVLAAGLAIGYAAPAEAVKIFKRGGGITNVTFGHNVSYDTYQVFTERGDTLESIAKEFQKRNINNNCGCSDGSIPVAANYLLNEIQQKYRFNGVNGVKIENTAQQLPAGLSFDYNVCTGVFKGFHSLI